MDFIAERISDRLGGRNFGADSGTYKFAVIKAAKARARAQNPGVPLIDMGVGEPDRPAPGEIAEVLYKEAMKPENRFYADNGIGEFCEAAARYLEKVYKVKGINPDRDILHGIGSKPILALLPAVFINPGDITLATVPGYPVISTWTRYLGGESYSMPLTEENGFFPDLDGIPASVRKRAKLMYINYPNNPTGQVATKEFYKKVVDFADRNRIAVVSDAAYAALTFGGAEPLSFLATEGARDVGVEVFSLSKAFNMTGWRLAFVAGNSKIISAYGVVKDNTDSGQFRAIQKAGVYALDHPEITDGIRGKYSRRHDLLVEALNELGFGAKKPGGTFYCYVRSPKGAGGAGFASAQEAASYFMEKALISVVPWDDAGPWLRFSVTFEAGGEAEEKRVIGEMKRRLAELRLEF